VVDLRSLAPVDWRTIFESVEKTGRLVAVDPRADMQRSKRDHGPICERSGALQAR
jgi:pyruvate/2-oxoglutarate/acetoin dehydrogenase E1 component